LQEVIIEPLPIVKWIYYIDASSGYIGTISDNRKLFELRGEGGTVCFSRKAQGEHEAGFVEVAMRNNPGLVLLTEEADYGVFRSLVFDYAGDVMMGPVTSSNIVALSPGGAYFYSFNDIGNDKKTPSVYGKDGNLLARFYSSGSWDLKALNDSLVLYRDEDDIQIIVVPKMSVCSEMSFEPDIASDLPASDLSPDSRWYAYSRYEGVVIWDLRERSSFYVPHEMINDTYVRPSLAISSGGTYLVEYYRNIRGYKIAVYELVADSYRRTAYDPVVSVGRDLEFLPNALFVEGTTCILNMFAASAQGITFSSYSFDAAIQGDKLQGHLREGLITLEPPLAGMSRAVRCTRIAGVRGVTTKMPLEESAR